MTGDGLKTIATGDPVRPSAHRENILRQVARGALRSRAQISASVNGAAPQGLILVQNNSGSNRDRFEILGVDSILVAPTDNLHAFNNRPALKGVTPRATTHTGKFVICWEPIPNTKIGRAFLFGYCTVQVNFQAATDPYADVTDNDATQLTSGSTGAAQVLWNPSGLTGKQWAFIRFEGIGGGLPPGGFQYSVLQRMDTLLTPGWEYVRAH